MPLPDLALPVTVLDFGQVYVGENKVMQYQLRNAGEAEAAATMTTSDALTFPLLDENVVLAPGQTYHAGVEFIPPKGGPFSAQIVVASNDPKTPSQIVVLKGVGVEPVMNNPPPPPPPPASDGSGGSGGSDSSDSPSVGEPSSCNCRAAGSSGGDGALGLAAAALGALALALRSRRARARRGGAAARVTR